MSQTTKDVTDDVRKVQRNLKAKKLLPIVLEIILLTAIAIELIILLIQWVT
jgi:hypothetical protein